MRVYSHWMGSRLFQATVILVTLGFLTLGTWGSLNMVSKFDPRLLLPTDSYLSKWVSTTEYFYPEFSIRAEVITGPLEVQDLGGLDYLVTELEVLTQAESGSILRHVSSWWPDFLTFLQTRNTSRHHLATTPHFLSLLSDFLHAPDYARHQHSFQFGGRLECGTAAPPVLATKQSLGLRLSSTSPPPSEYLPGMSSLQDILHTANLSSTAFYDSLLFVSWETEQIILQELWQNLGLAVTAVLIVSFLMLGDLPLTLGVLACVIFTLIDLIGSLYFWGITIDAISYINIILATGLAVDYSVHLAYAFSVAEGSRLQRVETALITLGPAVINGGVSTLLAVILLPLSYSHVLLTFFKVFSLTVFYGVFHGLVFLPTILSICG